MMLPARLTRVALCVSVGACVSMSTAVRAASPPTSPAAQTPTTPSALPPLVNKTQPPDGPSAVPAALTVVVHDGWVRLAPPGAKTMAAFMGWWNPGDTAVEVTAVATSLSARAELHTHLHENGVMKMRQVPAIVVPAKGETTLKPGGFHVMIFDVTKPPVAGDTVTITLTLKNGATVTATVPVLAAAPTPASTPPSAPAVVVPG